MEMVQYTVRPGNTLFGIAQFFQTTVNDILKYNNIQTPDAIFCRSGSYGSRRQCGNAVSCCPSGRFAVDNCTNARNNR